MRIIDPRNPFPNGFDPNVDQAKAEAALAVFQEIYDAISNGTAYIRYVDGDRKGSIAKVSFSDKYIKHDKPVISYRYTSWINDKFTRCLDNIYFRCTATWEGRRNKVNASFPSHEDIEVLLDYDGPTVWEKFDTKSAKEEILKSPDQKDIDGKPLNIGDFVLYINARYGSRMSLDKGMVIEFNVSVNSSGHTITTIIMNESGERSSLQYPENMVYKLD